MFNKVRVVAVLIIYLPQEELTSICNSYNPTTLAQYGQTDQQIFWRVETLDFHVPQTSIRTV